MIATAATGRLLRPLIAPLRAALISVRGTHGRVGVDRVSKQQVTQLVETALGEVTDVRLAHPQLE